MMTMKIIFMGTPEFAVASLDALLQAGHTVCAVVTVADKPAGRGQTIQQSAVKQYAAKHNLPVLQPLNLKDPQFISELKSYGADLQFVVAFRMLPEQVWNMPALGTFNLHGSLLPRYRGAAPINHAVMNGDDFSGITTFKLQQQIDTGSILLQEKVAIGPHTTAGELHDELMVRGAALVVRTADMIKESHETKKPLQFSVQDETQVSHAPKIFREHCKINWQESLKKVYNLVRGLSPYPAAYTEIISDGVTIKTLKIYKAMPADLSTAAHAGALRIEGGRLYVSASDGWLELLELQLEGKKRMTAMEFLNGQRAPEKLKIG
jgi:methionyl-tRNA formyltransferase